MYTKTIISANTIDMSISAATNPFGCCKTLIINSTAVDAAIDASPGRVTVHI